MENESDKYITVYTCTYPSEIAVVKGRLQAENIECSVQDELTIEANPFYSNALGGVKLQVKESDYDKALAILNENVILEEETVSESAIETRVSISGKTMCPKCGSFEVSKPKFSPEVIALSLLFIGFPFPWMSKTIHCFDCGGDFKYKKQ
jgi:hypothetical protein